MALEDRYAVMRRDGRSSPGEKHHGCQYFVLDLTHDPHARVALEAYAAASGQPDLIREEVPSGAEADQ